MENGNSFGFFLVIISILIVLWLILREFICWYYKINERVSLQKRTNQLLEELINRDITNNTTCKASTVTDIIGDGIKIYSVDMDNHGFICSSRDLSNGSMWPDAKRLCSNYNEGGFNDWRLPSKDELLLIFENLHKQGKGEFSIGTYWSSTEINIYNCWAQNFQSGERVENGKSSVNFVRAVRSF